MAEMSTQHSLVSGWISNIETAAKGVDSDNIDAEDKHKLLKEAKSLVEKLEGPEIAIWRAVWGPQAHAALRVAFEIRIFEVFNVDAEEKTAETLAAATGAEKLLLIRIMRALTTLSIFVESGEERYQHSAASRMLTNPIFRTLVIGLSGLFSPYMIKLPAYLSSNSFRNPTDTNRTLFNYAASTNLGYFEWLQHQPEQLAAFSATMAASSDMGTKRAATTVSNLFPANLVANVLLVDVGGGKGKILEDVRKQRPDLKGKMIVQDLPQEIDDRETAEGVEVMVYDFFTPQPIKGAHTYYFRHIFHDWPDSACREILSNTISAMVRKSSRIVVADAVLPNVEASLFSSLLDINMMTLSGIERTENHWRELLYSVGLDVVGMQSLGDGRDGIIEAVLRNQQ